LVLVNIPQAAELAPARAAEVLSATLKNDKPSPKILPPHLHK
jgi:hypothetical protein